MSQKSFYTIAMSGVFTIGVFTAGCSTEEITTEKPQVVVLESVEDLGAPSVRDTRKVQNTALEMAAGAKRRDHIASLAATGFQQQHDHVVQPERSRENYAEIDSNGVVQVAMQPVSTFSVDVDTGSYSNMRRFLNNGALPVADAIRIEELINYFSYSYKSTSGDAPFSITTEVGRTPWNEKTHLLHIGLKGYSVDPADIPASNLVFLLDVSGSMNSPRKLDLLKSSIKMMSRQLSARDRISIVVYAGAAGVVLEPTPGNNTAKIAAALNQLSAGGSTNGHAGIE